MSVREIDKRRYPRVEVNGPGQLRVADKLESGAQLIDICEGGATLFCSGPMAEGTTIELDFDLYVGEDTPCHAQAEVRHYFFNGRSHVIGVKFTHVEPRVVETIREFVRQTKRNLAG